MGLWVKIDLTEDGVGVLQTNEFDLFRNHFSWENEARRNMPAHVKRNVPKNEYLISFDGKFPIGILNEIFAYSKQVDPNITPKKTFVVSSRAKYYYEPSFTMPDEYDLHSFEGFEYRDIQEKAIARTFKRGRGIVEVGTGGGKGLVIASTIKTNWDYNPATTFSILVPTHLIHKTYEEFIQDYGFTESEISMWAAGEPNKHDTPISIFGPNFSVSRSDEFLDNAANSSVFMIDECHIVKQKSKITQLIRQIKTNNILGYTGTLPESKADKYSVLGTIGKVVCKVPSTELKDKGLKASSKVCSFKFNGSSYKNELSYVNDEGVKVTYTANQRFQNERDYLLTSTPRNAFIKKWVLTYCKGNTMIPVDLDYQEELLKEQFEDCGRKVIIINGKTPKKDRTGIYKSLETEKDVILIVKTGVMREGISIKNLSYMVGYFAQKSYIRIIQLIGRIERIGGNEVPIFYDFYDDLKYSSTHYDKRVTFYRKESIPVVEKNVTLTY